MSTSTRTAPSREASGGSTTGGRIISRPLLLVFLSEFCALTSFYLLLSVTPKNAAAGAGSAGAGLVTGMLLLGTVAAELAAPLLMKRYGYRPVLAAVGLLAQALTATISPWWAGRHGDRHGHARLLVPGLAIASRAMIWLTSPAAVIAAMCLFGTGFGIIQNATLALMIDRMPASGIGTASALWSLAYDAGYGAGPAVFGLLVTHIGYPAGFALTGVLMLAALPAARREHSADAVATGPHRASIS